MCTPNNLFLNCLLVVWKNFKKMQKKWSKMGKLVRGAIFFVTPCKFLASINQTFISPQNFWLSALHQSLRAIDKYPIHVRNMCILQFGYSLFPQDGFITFIVDVGVKEAYFRRKCTQKYLNL